MPAGPAQVLGLHRGLLCRTYLRRLQLRNGRLVDVLRPGHSPSKLINERLVDHALDKGLANRLIKWFLWPALKPVPVCLVLAVGADARACNALVRKLLEQPRPILTSLAPKNGARQGHEEKANLQFEI